jgi:hypothetical protein
MSGIDRAIIRGSCVGTESTCTRNLAAASILDTVSDAYKTAIVEQLRDIAHKYDIGYSSYVDKPGTNPLEKLAESTTNASTNINDAQSQQPQPQSSTNTVSPTPSTSQPTVTITTTDSNSIPFTVAPNTSGQGQPFSVKTEDVKPAEGNQPGQIGGAVKSTAEERNSNSNNKDELAELRAQYAELKNMVAPLVEFKHNTEKAETERKTAEKKAMLESVIPEDYANSTEEREKAIASLMKIDGSELDYIVDKFVVPLTGSSPCGNVKQAGRSGGGGCADKINDNPITKKRTLSRLTDYAKPNTNQNKVAQAGITGDNGNAVDDIVTSRILSMTRVVNSSRLSGAWR